MKNFYSSWTFGTWFLLLTMNMLLSGCYSLTLGYSHSKKMESIYLEGVNRKDMGIMVHHSSMKFSYREQDSLVAKIARRNNFHFRSVKPSRNPAWYFGREDLGIIISNEEFDRFKISLNRNSKPDRLERKQFLKHRNEDSERYQEMEIDVQEPCYAILHKRHECLPWVLIVSEDDFSEEILNIAIPWALQRIEQNNQDFSTHLLKF